MSADAGLPDGAYNVICPVHGRVQIGNDGYVEQMMDADDVWRCPRCRRASQFDDDTYEAALFQGD